MTDNRFPALLLGARFSAICLLAVASGCGGGGSQQDKQDHSKIVGTWLELRDDAGTASGTRRFVPPPPKTKALRKITLAEDGTFKMELVSKSGEPAKGAPLIEGTWNGAGRRISFEISSNSFAGDLQAFAPASSSGITHFTTEEEVEVEQLRIVDEEGTPVVYRRAP